MSSTTTTIDTAPAKYKGKQGSYKCEQLDCFSLDNDHRLVPSNKEAELGFLDESWLNKGSTRLNVSLLEGMAGAVEKRRDESLDKLFQWLMVTSGKGSSLREAVHGPRFVSRRGPLARLAASPYSADGPHDVGIRVACTKHKGFYFLVEFSTDDKKANEASRDDYQKRTCYAGLRFEQLMTGKLAEEEAKKKKADELHRPLDPNAEHNGVFTGLLKSAAGDPIEILCAAEVDCALEETGEFVELKTQLKQLGWGKAFGYKALSWYLQSYMIGIQQFVVGLHENCILHRVEKHQLEELLNWARAGGGWEPQVCLAFLHSLLGQLKAQLDGQPEGTIVVAERSAHGHQFRLQCILPEDVEGQKRWTVLTEEFKQFEWASDE